MTALNPISVTNSDIEALPPHMVGEILFGDLVTHPRSARRHPAALLLSAMLRSHFGFREGDVGGWLILDEPELRLDHNVMVPDFAGWNGCRQASCNEFAQTEKVPEWICEILEPDSHVRVRHIKRKIYHSLAVHHLWILDPEAKVLEVFEHKSQGWLLAGAFTGSDQVSAPPFDAISFSLGLLWPFDQPDEKA